jgi:hypothetical protein
MKVYHGSYLKIEEINLSKCEPNKDFGQGFYVTRFRHLAEQWAKRMGEKHKTEGVVTEFEFGKYFFKEADFKSLHFYGYTEDWLDFVVLNRTNRSLEQAHDYDYIEGPIADDRVTARIYDYLDGIVSKSKFLNELKFHEPTHQICFCTLHSLQLLGDTNRLIISTIENISEAVILHLIVNDKIAKKDATELFYKSATYQQLTDHSTMLFKKDWTEIYESLKKEHIFG